MLYRTGGDSRLITIPRSLACCLLQVEIALSPSEFCERAPVVLKELKEDDMSESLLRIRIAPIEGRSGSFLLSCDAISYVVEFHGTQVILNDLLRRAQAALVGDPDPSGQLYPF